MNYRESDLAIVPMKQLITVEERAKRIEQSF